MKGFPDIINQPEIKGFLDIINQPDLYWDFLISIQGDDATKIDDYKLPKKKESVGNLTITKSGGSGDKVWIGDEIVVKEYKSGKKRQQFVANEILITWFLSNVLKLKWPDTGYYMYPNILSIYIDIDKKTVQISQTKAPGKSLLDFKCEKPLVTDYHSIIVYQLIWMLHYTNKILQERFGILFSHNDLHPLNIFVDKMGPDKLTIMADNTDNIHDDIMVVSPLTISIIDMGEGTMRKTCSYTYLNTEQSGLKSFRSSTMVLEKFRNCKWETLKSGRNFVRHALYDKSKKGLGSNNIDLTFWITIAKYLVGTESIKEPCRKRARSPDAVSPDLRYNDCLKDAYKLIEHNDYYNESVSSNSLRLKKRKEKRKRKKKKIDNYIYSI